MNRKLIGLVAGGFMLGACTPAQTASYNLSNDSDNFRVMRRVVLNHYIPVSTLVKGQTTIGSR